MTEIKPRLYSDFDGTAVAEAYLLDPRNLTKYPLPEMEGYSEFLRGARLSADGQDVVEIAGVVTRRPNILIRRMVTARSVAKLGLREFFPDNSKLVHAGSEPKKAQFIYEQSALARTGMLEDQPHKLGAEILKIMAAQTAVDDGDERHILIGAVNTGKSGEYIDKLVSSAKELYGNAEISEFDYLADDDLVNVGHRIKIGKATLEIVQLASYSESSGTHFGAYLLGPELVEPEPEPVSLLGRVTFFVKTVGQEGLELIKQGRDRARSIGRRAAKAPRTIVIETLSGVKHVTIDPSHISEGTEVSVESVTPGDK